MPLTCGISDRAAAGGTTADTGVAQPADPPDRARTAHHADQHLAREPAKLGPLIRRQGRSGSVEDAGTSPAHVLGGSPAGIGQHDRG